MLCHVPPNSGTGACSSTTRVGEGSRLAGCDDDRRRFDDWVGDFYRIGRYCTTGGKSWSANSCLGHNRTDDHHGRALLWRTRGCHAESRRRVCVPARIVRADVGIFVWILTWINTRSVRTGAIVQNVFTLVKIAALSGLILLGFIFATRSARTVNFTDFWRHAGFGNLHAYGSGVWVHTPTLIGLAMVGALFSSSAWPNVTFTAAEVKNPSRNLPLSLALGTGLVMTLYILANLAYLSVLPLEGSASGASVIERGIQFASQDRVGTAAAEAVIGPRGAILVALAVIISTFGCNNGLILAGARIYYAMAKDGLFLRGAAKLHPTYRTPAVSLMVQMIWICVLCISGSYGQLLDYVVVAVLVFYILT